MRTISIFLVLSILSISCSKDPQPVSVMGKWILDQTEYDFQEKLTISSDGESEVFDYHVSSDTIYLSYGLPFKIESIENNQMILSKRDSSVFLLYRFLRIE